VASVIEMICAIPVVAPQLAKQRADVDAFMKRPFEPEVAGISPFAAAASLSRTVSSGRKCSTQRAAPNATARI